MIQQQITFLQSLLDSDLDGDGWEEVLCHGCSPAVGKGVSSLYYYILLCDICIMSFISCGGHAMPACDSDLVRGMRSCATTRSN